MLSDRMKEYIQQLLEQSLKLMESPETIAEAIEKLKLILTVEPGNVDAIFNLGKALTLTGNIAEGLHYLNQARDKGYDGNRIEEIISPINEEEKIQKHVVEVTENLTGIVESKEKPNYLSIQNVLLAVSLLIVTYFSRNFLTPGYLLGWDSMSHVFKTWFTTESMLGRSTYDWCEYWYQGSPIMPMYAPLFYLTSALIGIITRLNALEASKWMVFLSFPLSSLSFYYFTKRDKLDIAAISGALLYSLIPWHFTYITILGNPTYLLCYLFLPPLFKYLKGEKQSDLILSSISFSLTTLSHQGTGFLIAYILIWYHLITGLLNRDLRKTLKKLVIIGAISAGLLAFFWMPYLYYSRITSSFQIPFQPKYERLSQLLQPNHFMYLGIPVIIILLVSTSVILISKNKEGRVYTLLTLLSIIITFWYQNRLVKIIYPFARIIGSGYRFNIFTSFTIAMMTYIAIKEVPNILRNIKVIKLDYKKEKLIPYILLALTTILTIAAFLPVSNFYNMPIPKSHMEIYELISDNSIPGRVWWLPRGALQTSIPVFTSRSTPDGWYDQGAFPEVNIVIHDLADVQIIENPEYFVSKLAELSVTFLIVEKGVLSEKLYGIDGLRIIHESSQFLLLKNDVIIPTQSFSNPSFGKIIKVISLIITIVFSVGIFIIHRKKDAYYNILKKIRYNTISVIKKNITKMVDILYNDKNVKLFFIILLIYSAFKHQILLGSVCRNMFYFTASIVDTFSMNINNYETWGYDVAYINSDVYSVLAPGASILLAPSYFLGRIFGIPKLNPFMINVFTALISVLTIIFTYILANMISEFRYPNRATYIVFIISFSTIFWPISEYLYFNNVSTFLSTFVITLYIYALKIDNDNYIYTSYFILGLSSLAEYPLVFLFLPLSIVLVKKRKWRTLIFSTTLFSIALIPVFLYNKLITGNFLLFPESLYWRTAEWPKRFDISISHVLHSLYSLLFSYNRGLLYFSPILLLFFPANLQLWKKDRTIFIIFNLIIIINLIFYSTFVDPSKGGPGYGARWQLSIIPLMVSTLVLTPLEKKPWKKIVFLLQTISVFFAAIGVVLVPINHWYLYHNLPLEMITGTSDSAIDNYIIIFSRLFDVKEATKYSLNGAGATFIPKILENMNPLYFPLIITLSIMVILYNQLRKIV